MIITDQITRYVVTLGAGATQTTFPFDYLDVSTIYVYYNGMLKTLNADYTINNKTITFTPALTITTKISIILTVPYGKDIEFIEPEEWNANTVNTIFAKLALQIMEIRDKAILVGDSSPILTVDQLISEVETASTSAAASAASAANSATNARNSETSAAASAAAAANSATTAGQQSTIALLAANTAIMRAGEAQQFAIQSSSSATSSSSSATTATNASQSATASATSATNSATSATASELKASQWADSTTDVEPNRKSAKTWAQAASAIAIPDHSIGSIKMAQEPIEFTSQIIVGEGYFRSSLTTNSLIFQNNILNFPTEMGVFPNMGSRPVIKFDNGDPKYIVLEDDLRIDTDSSTKSWTIFAPYKFGTANDIAICNYSFYVDVLANEANIFTQVFPVNPYGFEPNNNWINDITGITVNNNIGISGDFAYLNTTGLGVPIIKVSAVSGGARRIYVTVTYKCKNW